MTYRCLLTIALTAVLTSAATAETVVFPEIYTDANAPGASGPWGPVSSRGMTIYSSDGFPDEPVLITELALRPDRSRSSGTEFGWDNIELLLSVTPTQPRSLSSNFVTNIQNSVTEQVSVFNEEWYVTVPEQSSLEFEWRFPLDEPYMYDPADGNLLVDWIFGVPVPEPRGSFDTNSSPTSDHAAVWTGNASNSQGGRQFTVVTQFTFEPVPEPALESILLAPLVVLSYMFRRRRET